MSLTDVVAVRRWRTSAGVQDLADGGGGDSMAEAA
jgi:hypothetical protein